jgi:dUTP pyrophosphatase
MEIKVKKLHNDAVIPKYAKHGDACVDLTAVSISEHTEHDYIEYGIGLSIEIPDGHVGLIYPRSSVTHHYLMMKNSVGVIDSGYRGELKVRFQSMFPGMEENIYVIGDRVAQLMVVPIPVMGFTEVEELSLSERGAGGYGSSGR